MEPLPPNLGTSSNIGPGNRIELPSVNPEIMPSLENSIKQEKSPLAGEADPSKNIQQAPIIQTPSSTILPPIVPSNDGKVSNMTLGGVTPSVASETKLEPGWINAAKKIISTTANEPHQREEAFKGLKSDYQKKRLESSAPQ